MKTKELHSLHLRATSILNNILALEENIEESESIEDKEGYQKRIKILNDEYGYIMLKLYNPELSKHENLWQTLNAVRMNLDMNFPISQDTLNLIKEALQKNKP